MQAQPDPPVTRPAGITCPLPLQGSNQVPFQALTVVTDGVQGKVSQRVLRGMGFWTAG